MAPAAEPPPHHRRRLMGGPAGPHRHTMPTAEPHRRRLRLMGGPAEHHRLYKTPTAAPPHRLHWLVGGLAGPRIPTLTACGARPPHPSAPSSIHLRPPHGGCATSASLTCPPTPTTSPLRLSSSPPAPAGRAVPRPPRRGLRLLRPQRRGLRRPLRPRGRVVRLRLAYLRWRRHCSLQRRPQEQGLPRDRTQRVCRPHRRGLRPLRPQWRSLRRPFRPQRLDARLRLACLQ